MSDPQPPTDIGSTRSRWILVGVALLLLGSALLVGLLSNTPDPAATIPLVSTPTIASTPDVPDAHGDLADDAPEVARIAATDAKAQYDAGKAIFVDVRPGTDYAAAHIGDAVSITSPDLEPRLQSLSPDTTIITYAAQSAEQSSVRGAQIFMELGYTNVAALQGGLEGWQALGYPVASGR